MKYTVKEDVWQDKITGQRYTKDYAWRPVVSFDENGKPMKGYAYSPYGVGDGIEKIRAGNEKFGFPAHDMGQKIFLTEEQAKERFEYLGKLERKEDIAKEIQYYTEEECNFDNLEWLATMTLFDLTHPDAGGQFQCVHAKLLEFLLKNAPTSEKMEKIKKIYFENAEWKRGTRV
jgi:hypothetical protein